MTTDDVHVYPTGDLIDHTVDCGDCLCGPTTSPVERGDGTLGWVVTHHSLDGREFTESDYAGPHMPSEP